MNKSFVFILVLFTKLHIAFTQYFSIEDIETGRLSYLRPAGIANLNWYGNSAIAYSRGDTLLLFDTQKEKETALLTKSSLEKALRKHNLPQLKTFPVLHWLDSGTFWFNVYNSVLFFNPGTETSEFIYVPDTADYLTIAPVGRKVAYTIGQNLFLSGNGKVIQVTNDSKKGIVNGQVVYRQEFGMETGIYWSPRGKYLAYYRKDESAVTEYPIVDITARVAKVVPERYPMAGMASEKTEIWIYSLQRNKKIKLQVKGGPESYHTNLSWSPDEKYIYLQHLNRGQDTMVLCRYSAETGARLEELFTETDGKYVEPMNPLVFSSIQPGNFIYQSERDGYNHLYYYDAGKRSLIQLTKGEWEVTGTAFFSKDEQFVLFSGKRESPLENHVYRYDFKSGLIERLTSDAGTHSFEMNGNGSMFIDTYSSSAVPLRIHLCASDGNIIKVLHTAKNPLEKYVLGNVEIGTITAADNKTPLYYRITKPVEFDSLKKYPVIVYVYGGPHVQLINNRWMTRTEFLHQYYAQRGIVSFELDCRGSDYRGRDFEDIIHRQLGKPQVEDQYEGVKFLKKLEWIDTSRIGVQGWSFGGYMTISMMLHYPETFKVGVSGGAVTDWKFYEVMYGERYMDTPEENPDGYHQTSLLPLAGNLKGKLLLIHGARDHIVVWQHTLVFVQSCIEKGRMVNYFVYPTQDHNVLGSERLHLTELSINYFLDNL